MFHITSVLATSRDSSELERLEAGERLTDARDGGFAASALFVRSLHGGT